jgi:hypothetical protein
MGGQVWTAWFGGGLPKWDDGITAWLGELRVASNVTIIVASAYAAGVLYLLMRRRGDIAPAPRVVGMFAGLILMGGFTQLVLLNDGQVPGSLAPTMFKLIAAGLWVAVALELPVVIARLSRPLPLPPCRASAGAGGHAARRDDVNRLADELTQVSQNLRQRACELEAMIRDETWIHDRDDALHELHGIINDLGGARCKT